jgi:hypothetical protein
MIKSAQVKFCAVIRKELPKDIALQPGTRRYNAVVARTLELIRGLLSK